jgi:O-antigen/teichoic acid export membrane protein
LSARAVRYLGLLALVMIVAVSITAPDLLRVLFGVSYVAATPALRILVWLALLGATGTVFTNLLIARGHERLLLLLNICGSGLTIGLSLLLVRRNGFAGAAVATLVASVLSQALLLVMPATRRDVVACLRPLAWPALASIAIVLAGTALPGPRLAIAAAALVVFAGAVVAAGAVDRRDWPIVRALIARPPVDAALPR